MSLQFDRETKSKAILLRKVLEGYDGWDIKLRPLADRLPEKPVPLSEVAHLLNNRDRLSTSVDASVDAQKPSVDATSKTQLDALQMMLEKGYTLEQIKGVLEALGEKSTDENRPSTDNRQTKEDLATLSRRRERDKKYQAERRRKLKEGGNSSVDAQKRDISIEDKIDTKKEDKKERKTIKYDNDFENFWRAYPRTPNMGKSEAFGVWKKLPTEERQLALAAVPKYVAWLKTQKPDYPVIHACRFLSKRRFDGFQEAVTGAAVNSDEYQRALEEARRVVKGT